jgi:hypothetical protein
MLALRFAVLMCAFGMFMPLVFAEVPELNMKKLGFIEASLPKRNSDEWKVLRESSPYFVGLENETLSITKGKFKRREPIEVDTGFVKYIGVNRGEFGGGIYLNQYIKDKKPFFEENIIAMIPYQNDLYIFAGLSHGFRGISERGAIYVMRNYQYPSQPVLLTVLHDEPVRVSLVIPKYYHEEKQQWFEDEDAKSVEFVVLFQSSLVKFTLDSRRKTPDLKFLAFDAIWDDLGLSSIVKYKNWYVIGVSSGVIVVSSTMRFGKYTTSYYIPQPKE